ncbi:unnamed protein product, partial [Ceratitis capitata]
MAAMATTTTTITATTTTTTAYCNISYDGVFLFLLGIIVNSKSIGSRFDNLLLHSK